MRVISLLFLSVCLPPVAEAGLKSDVCQLKETATAPSIVVGHILAIHKNERVPEGSLPWKAETWSMTADVEVIRSYTPSAAPIDAGRLQVHFLSYGPDGTASINGFPPPLPQLETDQIRILPLRRNANPASEAWELTAESGTDVTIPVHADTGDAPWPQPPTARAFLIRELANTLSRGSAFEVNALSGYLSRQSEDLSGELLPLLEPVIGQDRQRWAEMAANLLAAQGIPGPSTAELFLDKPATLRGNLTLAQAALRKLKASPETDELLIRTWIGDAPLNAWGVANSLLEYADNPLTTAALGQSLRDDEAGSSYIALVFAHNNHRAILPDALARAFSAVDRPDAKGAESLDVEGAAALVRDFGTDEDLKRLAALVRKYQTEDPKFYNMLWQYASYSGNPREARVLAVVLSDRRVVSGGTLRYCDYALGVLERATGQHFGESRATLSERDAAISAGLAWIKEQGLIN